MSAAKAAGWAGPEVGESIEQLTGGEWHRARVDAIYPEANGFGWRVTDLTGGGSIGGLTSLDNTAAWRRVPAARASLLGQAIALIERVRARIEGTCEPVSCVAEGHLQAALSSLAAADELLDAKAVRP